MNRQQYGAQGLRQRLGSVYYGWWALAAGFVIATFSAGIFSHSIGVFFGPIKADLGLNNTQTSLIFSLTRAEGSVTGPLFGRMVDRFGARPMILFGGLTACAGFIMLSWVHSYWLFALIFVAIVATGKSSGMGHTLLAAVNRWFVGRKALALSIQITGFQLGGAVILPLVVIGVNALGWRDVMLIGGIFMAVILVPLAMVIRHSPERMGIEPEGAAEARRRAMVQGSSGASQAVDVDFTVREALATRAYWLMMASAFIRISVWGALAVHAVQIFQWKGLEETTAGFMFSLMFAVAVPTTLASGMLAQRFRFQSIMFYSALAASAGIAALIFLDGMTAVALFVLGTAAGEGGNAVQWAGLGQFFGRKSYATLFGIMSAAFNVGMFLTPIFAGWIRDTHDESYMLVVVAFAPLYAVGAVLCLFLKRPPSPQASPPVPRVS